MRAVVQCVTESSVEVNGVIVSSIGRGLNVLLGVSGDDNEADIDYICDKLLNLRIFKDSDDKINLSVKDIGGELLIISQFTLYGDARKGRRPSFTQSAAHTDAVELYEKVLDKMRENYKSEMIKTGVFREYMRVSIVNDGPTTILLDSKRGF